MRNDSTTHSKFGSNFLISILHQENHSYQGVIEWLDTGKKVHFRSELELMNLIHNAVQATSVNENPMRSWEDERKISVV